MMKCCLFTVILLVAGPSRAADWQAIASGADAQLVRDGDVAGARVTVTGAADAAPVRLELRHSAPETQDIGDRRALQFEYRIEGGADADIRNMWVALATGWGKDDPRAQLDGLDVTPDGQWHTAIAPVWGFTPSSPEWPVDRWRHLTFNTFVRAPDGKSVEVTLWVRKLAWLPRGDRPAILIDVQPDVRLAKAVEQAGFVWHWGALRDRHRPDRWMSRPLLKFFDVIVMTHWPQLGAEGVSPEQQQVVDYLRWFVDAGGGLFICGGNDQDIGRCVAFQNLLLEPWGAKVLREHVLDPAHRYRGLSATVGWTDDIVTSPLTEGVSGLFYSMERGWGGTSSTNPVAVDDSWQILVRAKQTASSHALTDDNKMSEAASTYAAAPPLVAVRQVGKGRVVLWPMLATATFVDGYHFVWDHGLVLDGRAGDWHSDGLRLVKNLLAWLAESAIATPELGGFVPPPREPRDLSKEPGFQAIDWANKQVPDGPARQFKVLIGARTAYSSGSGSVADWAAAARQQGYDVLVITEDLERMDAAKWATLKAACRAASDDAFQAVEGLHWTDEVGDRGVVFGDIGWPEPQWFSEKHPGRIKVLWYFTHGMRFWPPLAVIVPGKNPKPPWFLGKSKGFATHTYEDGKLVDESVELYLELMHQRYDNWPLAVHLMKAPTDVATAAAGDRMQTFVRAPQLAEVVPYMSEAYNKAVGWYWPIYVSNGPEIRTFQALNAGTTDLQIPGAERHRLRLHATNATPITEVRLLDGPRLLRRFAANTTDFDRSLDFFHDRQRTYVAVVRDAAGRQAISWDRWVEVQEQWFTNCGDNWNYMDGGKWKGTRYTSTRGQERYFHPAGPWWISPTVHAVDAAGERLVVYPSRPTILTDKVMVSRFCSIVDFKLVGRYDDSATMNWNDFAKAEAIHPLDYVDYRIRRIFFTSRPDHVRPEWFQAQLRARKPFTLKSPVELCAVANGDKLPYDLTTYSRADGMQVTERRPEIVPRTYAREGPLPVGGYVAMWPYPGGSVGLLGLSEGLGYHLRHWAPHHTRFYLTVGAAGRELAAGDELTWSFLEIAGPRFEEIPGNGDFEAVQHGYGLAGAPPWRAEARVGTIDNIRYALRGTAVGGGLRVHLTQTDLPSDLPVIVAGLNDRWQAVVWYPGTQPFEVPEWDRNEYDQLICLMRRRDYTDRLLPGPVEEGAGWFGVDARNGARDVFVGHPLVCDNADLFLQLTAWQEDAVGEVHNPGTAAVTTVLRPGAGFDLFGDFTHRIDVPAGTSVFVDLRTGEQR